MRKNGSGLKVFTLSLIALLFFFYCGGKKEDLYPQGATDKVLYDLGMKFMKKKKYEKAREVLTRLIELYPRSKYAPRAKLAIADSYFKKKDLTNTLMAINEYQEFLALYPYHPRASYAQYQIAMCYYRRMRKPGRDQEATLKAIEEFKKVIEKYPLAEEAKLAKEKLKECRIRYAEHIFGIANFYFKIKAYRASYQRFKMIIKDYSEFPKMPEVYYKFSYSAYKIKEMDEAKAYLSKILSDYPRTKWAKKAKKLLKTIEKEEKHGETKRRKDKRAT